MQRECVMEGPTVEDALDAALEQLGVQQDAVQYEVLEEPGKRMFGLGGKSARVRVWVTEEAMQEMLAVESDDDDGEAVRAVPESSEAAPGDLSDEDLDRVADTAVEALKTILDSFGVADVSIEEYEGDEGEIILDVVGGDLAILIGRHGKTLDSLQSLVSAITTRKLGFRYPVVVDIEGYRHRRRQKVEEIARRAADRAARQHIPVKLRPMTAYERRIVHVALRNDRRVKTESDGAEPFRQVVVKPK